MCDDARTYKPKFVTDVSKESSAFSKVFHLRPYSDSLNQDEDIKFIGMSEFFYQPKLCIINEDLNYQFEAKNTKFEQ